MSIATGSSGAVQSARNPTGDAANVVLGARDNADSAAEETRPDVFYVYGAFDAVTDELIASLNIEGPADGAGVLRFAAFESGELFDRPYYLTTGHGV